MEASSMSESLRKAILAGVGAISTVSEKSDELLDQLAEHGEELVQKTREKGDELIEKTKEKGDELAEKGTEVAGGISQDVLRTMMGMLTPEQRESLATSARSIADEYNENEKLAKEKVEKLESAKAETEALEEPHDCSDGVCKF